MSLAVVVERRIARINDALHECANAIAANEFAVAVEFAMQAVNMGGQYCKEASDLANLLREKGCGDIARWEENAALFDDMRGMGIAYYHECTAQIEGPGRSNDFDLNDPRM